MPAINISAFKGLAPAVTPTKLIDGGAQTAIDFRVEAGSLQPEKNSAAVGVAIPANANSIFKWKDLYWLYSTNNESFVDSPLAKDVHERLYMAGGTYPRYTTRANTSAGFDAAVGVDVVTAYRLGVPQPSAAPVVNVSGAVTVGQENIIYTTTYVYTYVTQFGEEGPASAATDFVEYKDGQSKNITVTAPPSGSYAFGAGAAIRIYRTATGSSTSDFLFVGEIGISATTFADTLLDEELGEVMTSTFNFKPLDDDAAYAPDGPLKGLTAMAGGFLAGFAGKTVAFSKQYLPHAWDPANSVVTEAPIVAIKEAAFGLLVLTETVPYLAAGSTPDTMGLQKLDIDQPCVSAKSVAELAGGVIYASPDGLVFVTSNSSQLITKGLITRDQWQQTYTPTSILGVSHENRYFAFFTTGDRSACLVFDIENSEAPFVELTLHTTAAHVSAKDDALYLLSGTALHQYGAGAAKEFTYKSKSYFLIEDTAFAWCRVICDGRPTIKVYVDGDKKSDNVVDTNIIFRLPATMRGRELEIEIESSTAVHSVSVATNRGEL